VVRAYCQVVGASVMLLIVQLRGSLMFEPRHSARLHDLRALPHASIRDRCAVGGSFSVSGTGRRSRVPMLR